MLSTLPDIYTFDDLPRELQQAIDAHLARFDLADDAARAYRQYRADRFAWLEWAMVSRPELVECRRVYLERHGEGVDLAMVRWVMGGQMRLL